MKKYSQQLSELLSFDDIEKSIILPLEHYRSYRCDLQDLVNLVPPTNSCHKPLVEALSQVSTQTDSIDSKLKAEEESLHLLALQQKFIGNPAIYTPTRKLIKEGDIERVKAAQSGEGVSVKPYYAHLFNDAFIFSGKYLRFYKLHKVVSCGV